MTQEFIDKHIAEICHYLGHPILERYVENPSMFEFFNSLAWCMDVCGAPRHMGFFVFDITEWHEFNEWLHNNMAYLPIGSRNRLYANTKIFFFQGYDFTVVRKYNQ